MANKKIPALLVGLLLLISCQPEVVLVDVTRLVEVTPLDTKTPATIQPAAVASIEAVEVTRVVSHEVTRVVTSTVVEEISIEVTRLPLGTAERPVQLLFVPTANTAVISRRGQVLSQVLAEATGMNFEIGVLDDEQAVIRLMCAAPMDTVGFLSPIGYVLAREQCGALIGNVAIHADGLSWTAGMILVRRDSGIDSLEQLAGKRWALPDVNSVTLSLFFQAMFADGGIDVGEIVEVQGDNSAMLAVYNREADFATAAYVPPILPYDERAWRYGEDSPEIWRRVGISPRRSPIGYVLVNGEPEFGGYRLRDARSGIFDIVPGIYDETRVLSLSAPVPNDTIAFGADFPLGKARQILAALIDFADSDACTTSLCSTDFFGWAGLTVAEEATYDPVRFMITILGLTAGEIPNPNE
jgi:phosphonate transport system substrate-binding protein